jgi:hypothetical protein
VDFKKRGQSKPVTVVAMAAGNYEWPLISFFREAEGFARRVGGTGFWRDNSGNPISAQGFGIWLSVTGQPDIGSTSTLPSITLKPWPSGGILNSYQ